MGAVFGIAVSSWQVAVRRRAHWSRFRRVVAFRKQERSKLVAVRSYHDLIVWQKAVAFSVLVYQTTKMFPSAKQFGLTNQLRRAAVSIPSNIAEGHAQESDGVLTRYLNIAIGSAAELDTQLLIAHKIGYIDAENLSHIQQDLTEIVKLLRGLLRSIRAK